MAITIALSGIFLILSTTPHAANASSCSQQVANHGGQETGSGSSKGSCAVSSSVHANPTKGGGVIVLSDHGSACTSFATSKSGQSFGGSASGSCSNSGTSSHSP